MKVINFFGAPGVGKTTNALLLTAFLKQQGFDAEISLEVVKEYVFANNQYMISLQNGIFAKQDEKLRVFLDSKEVEFTVTDSPLLLSCFYAPKDYAMSFKELVFETFQSYDNVNFFVNRNHPYSHQGRLHNEEDSIVLNQRIKSYLINNSIPFHEINSTDNLNDFVLPYIIKEHRVPNYKEYKKER